MNQGRLMLFQSILGHELARALRTGEGWSGVLCPLSMMDFVAQVLIQSPFIDKALITITATEFANTKV